MVIGNDRHPSSRSRTRTHGFVLPAALMILTALALVAVSLQSLTFVQRQLAVRAHENLEARWVSIGALHETIFALTQDIGAYDAEAWRSGVRLAIGGKRVFVKITDTSSLLDLNAATVAQISNHLQQRSVDRMRADQLAALIADWRDADDLVRLNGAEADRYLAEGMVAPGNRRFLSVSEASQLLSISATELQIIRDDFTVFGGAAYLSAARTVGVVPTQIKAGTSARVDISCCDVEKPTQHLRSVVTLTGDKSGAYWVRSFEMWPVYESSDD